MSPLAPGDQPDIRFKDNVVIAFNLWERGTDEVPIKRRPDGEFSLHWLSEYNLSTGRIKRQCQFVNNLLI